MGDKRSQFRKPFIDKYPSINNNNQSRENVQGFFSIINSGNINELESFLSNNIISINTLDNDGKNALHIIVESKLNDNDKYAMVEYLINKGIKTGVKDNEGNTPLLIACSTYSTDIINLLLENNIVMNQDNSLGITPLHHLSKGTTSKCKILETQKFIGDPNESIVNKINVSKISKLVYEKYDSLINNPVGQQQDLQYVEGTNRNINYPNRFADIIKHINHLLNHYINNDDEFSDSEEIKSVNERISNILRTTSQNDDELKIQLKEVSNQYKVTVVKNVKSKFRKMFEKVDFTSLPYEENAKGIYLTENAVNVYQPYNTYPANALNGTPIQEPVNGGQPIDYFRIDDNNTLDQYLSELIENEQESIDVSCDTILNDVVNFMENFSNDGSSILDAISESFKFNEYLQIVNNLNLIQTLGQNNIQIDNGHNNIVNYPDQNNPPPVVAGGPTFRTRYGIYHANVGFLFRMEDPNNIRYPTPNYNVNTEYDLFGSTSITIRYDEDVGVRFNKNIDDTVDGLLAVQPPAIIRMIVLKYRSLSHVNVRIYNTTTANAASLINGNGQNTFFTELTISLNQVNIFPGLGIGHGPAIPNLQNIPLVYSNPPNNTQIQRGANPHIYTPIYEMHKSIDRDFRQRIERITNQIKMQMDQLKNNKNFSNFNNLYSEVVDLLFTINRFMIRYHQFMLEFENENIVGNEHNRIIEILQRFQSSQLGSQIVHAVNQHIGETEYSYNHDAMSEFLTQLGSNFHNIIKSLESLNNVNIVNSYWNYSLQNNPAAPQNNVFVKDFFPEELDEPLNFLEFDNYFANTFNHEFKTAFGNPHIENTLYDRIANDPTITLAPAPGNVIRFDFTGQAPNANFRRPDHKVYNIDNYIYYAKHRLLQEIVLYIFNNPIPNNPIKLSVIPTNNLPPYLKEINDLIQSKQGNFKDHIRIPLILSVVSNIIDEYTTTNLENTVNRLVMDKFNRLLGRVPRNVAVANQPVIIQPARAINMIQIDDEFSLNLATLDRNVREVLENAVVNENDIINLGKGDLLINVAKSRFLQKTDKNEITQLENESKQSKQTDVAEILEMKFYPESYNSNQLNDDILCIKHNKKIYNKILKVNNINKQDYYGNTPLMYAVKAKNIFAMNELLNKHANVLYKNN